MTLMTVATENDLAVRLDALRTDARLSEAVRSRAASLARRLAAPVRVVVAGPPGSGKSTLIRLLAGDTDAGAPFPSGTRHAEIRSGRFRNVVLVEYPAPPAEDAPGAVPLGDVAPDIVLWCSQAFDAAERRFWSRVPDDLKDRSFLVLAKADALIRAGLLPQRLAALEPVVREEFHSLLPIATPQALAAAGTDPAEHAPSGARALCETLRRMVAQGRGATLDAATLFLRAHQTARQAEARVPAGPATAAEPAQGTPPGPVPAGSGLEPAPPADPVTEATAAVSHRALAVLDAHVADFPEELGEAEGEIAALLGLCAQTAEALHEIVTGQEAVADDLAEDVLEAAEMMVLLALEDDATAAADAVTLLLQLRRGFETRLAA